MSQDAFDDDASPALEVTSPFDLDGTPPEALDHHEPGPRYVRWLGLAVGVVVVLSAVGVSVYRSAQREHQRTAYDKLVALSAAGQNAIDSGVSATRDVVQYAEPQLNSPQATMQTRTELLAQITTTARTSHAGIEARRAELAKADAPGRMSAAKQATLVYLDGWAAVFASAGGSASDLDAGDQDLLAQQNAARTALRAAAPDKDRAAEADTVLGALGW